MATTKNPQAEKAAKQKKLLIVLGVGLLAVGGIQVPRLMGGGDDSSSQTASATDTTAATDTAGSGAALAAQAAAAATSVPVQTQAELLPGEAAKRSPRTTLVGVHISAGTPVRATQGQLASFSLFKPKDPFAPQVKDKQAGASDTIGTKPAPETTAAKPAEATTSASAPTAASGTGSTTPAPAQPATAPVAPAAPAAPVAPPRYTTVSVNGLAESVEVKAAFPKAEPLFVLAKVKPGFVRIGIAGGKLENGATVLVEVGETITLVDSASGVRYVVKVISVGAEPDLTFTSMVTAGQADGAATTAATTTATP